MVMTSSTNSTKIWWYLGLGMILGYILRGSSSSNSSSSSPSPSNVAVSSSSFTPPKTTRTDLPFTIDGRHGFIAQFDIANTRTRSMNVFGTLDYRIFLEYRMPRAEPLTISYWHDIPLYYRNQRADGIVHFVCEIPKWTKEKMETTKHETYNPIYQDRKNGAPRLYSAGGMLFNYGGLPQTWENPGIKSAQTGYLGDGDPIDAVDVGVRQCQQGEVLSVRVLGVLALIDEGETDWKLVTINSRDILAPLLNDIDDVDTHLPGALSALREYMRTYKVPDGKPLNTFALDEKFMPRSYALQVVDETHRMWQDEVDRQVRSKDKSNHR